MVWFIPPLVFKLGSGAAIGVKALDTLAKTGKLYSDFLRPKKVSSLSTSWVKLNVGGREFLSTKKTLLSQPRSLFYDILGESIADASIVEAADRSNFTVKVTHNHALNRTVRVQFISHQKYLEDLKREKNLRKLRALAWKRDKQSGTVFLDRDPRYFSYVLNWLRNGKLIVDDGVALYGVLEEANFFNIHELVHLLHQRGIWERGGNVYFRDGDEVSEALPGVDLINLPATAMESSDKSLLKE